MIISSSLKAPIEKFLLHNNIHLFSEILDGEFHKSKKEKFIYLLEKYNYKPTDCLFITDTLGDIKESHSVNIKTIAVSYGFHNEERLQKGHPYKVCKTAKEVIKEIELLQS